MSYTANAIPGYFIPALPPQSPCMQAGHSCTSLSREGTPFSTAGPSCEGTPQRAQRITSPPPAWRLSQAHNFGVLQPSFSQATAQPFGGESSSLSSSNVPCGSQGGLQHNTQSGLKGKGHQFQGNQSIIYALHCFRTCYLTCYLVKYNMEYFVLDKIQISPCVLYTATLQYACEMMRSNCKTTNLQDFPLLFYCIPCSSLPLNI